MTYSRLGGVCKALQERWKVEANCKRAEHKAAWRRAHTVAGQITWAVLAAAGAKIELSDCLPKDEEDSESDRDKTTLDEINEDLEAKGLRGPNYETVDGE